MNNDYELRITNNSNWLIIKDIHNRDLRRWAYFYEFCSEFSYIWKKTTVENRKLQIKNQIVKLYLFEDNTFSIPSGFWYRLHQFLKKRNIPHKFNYVKLNQVKVEQLTPDWGKVEREFQFREGQKECLELVDRLDRGIINAATGWGKTEVISMICALYPKARIFVVARQANLAEQIRQRLQQKFVQVGMIGNGKNELCRITVVVARSLHYVVELCDSNQEPDIILADEVDQLAAPSYVEELAKIKRAKMIGFTASANVRFDGRDKEIEALFGPIVYQLDYQEAQQLGNIVPIRVFMVNYKTTISNLIPSQKLHYNPASIERYCIWKNKERNKKIAEIVQKLLSIDPNLQILVITKTLEHAVGLLCELPDFKICYSTNRTQKINKIMSRLPNDVISRITVNKKELMEMQDRFSRGEEKRIIATYVWSTGVDFRYLNVVVRADAAASRTKSIQIPGRACRRIPGVKESALVIDIYDRIDAAYTRRSDLRARQYRKNGWKVSIIDSPDEIVSLLTQTQDSEDCHEQEGRRADTISGVRETAS